MADQKSTKPGHRFIDLTGRKFGDWTVQSLHSPHGSRTLKWKCLCSCGAVKVVIGDTLRIGTSTCCGCRNKHGMKNTPEWWSWMAAKTRCFNPNTPYYVNYGGRGITMSDEWRNSFPAFYADMGPRPDGCELDRIDNDGPYTGPCPEYPNGNCRWVTQTVNARNRRRSIRVEYKGKLVSLRELSELTGIKYNTIKSRYWDHNPLVGRK